MKVKIEGGIYTIGDNDKVSGPNDTTARIIENIIPTAKFQYRDPLGSFDLLLASLIEEVFTDMEVVELEEHDENVDY